MVPGTRSSSNQGLSTEKPLCDQEEIHGNETDEDRLEYPLRPSPRELGSPAEFVSADVRALVFVLQIDPFAERSNCSGRPVG